MAPPRESRWRRRVKFGAGPLVLLALAGVTYQSVSNAVERRAFPHPGRRLDVGDHQLHLYCTGEGKRTVVLEAPAAAVSVAWAPVQLRVSEFARACSYDRAGLGWSESDGSRFNPADVPRQLHALLTTGQIPGPYVMVGHGLGAALARQYARQFPEDTMALVVIDAPGSSVQPRAAAMPGVRPEAWPWLARFGILRLTGVLTSMANGLPDPHRGAMKAFLNRPDHLSRSAEELSRWDESVRLGGADDDVTIPVIAVQAKGPDQVGLLTDGEAVTQTVAAIRRAIATTARTRP